VAVVKIILEIWATLGNLTPNKRKKKKKGEEKREKTEGKGKRTGTGQCPPILISGYVNKQGPT